MNRTNQRNIMFLQIFDCLGKRIICLTLYTEIFISRDNPLGPPFRGLGIIPTLNSCKIKPIAEVFPWKKGPGKVRHCSPNSNQISLFIYFS